MRLVASVIATKGPITPLAYTPVLDYTDEVFAAVERVATPKLAHAITIALKADRNAATDAAGDETVKELAKKGVKRLAVVTPGFVADCLETIEEIGIENRDIFLEHGGEQFARIDCLNASPQGMDVIEAVVKRELSGWV